MTARPGIASRRTLPVAEVFASVQGEGPHTGMRCGFVRLGYCNLSCSWCDTAFTWDSARHDVAAGCPERHPGEVHRVLEAAGLRDVVLTGGEPMLWADTPALRTLLDAWWRWHVETNGTIGPPWWWRDMVETTVVSPKLAHSGVAEARRLVPGALRAWAREPRAVFKFVCRQVADLTEVAHICATYRIAPGRVWIMPEGTDAATVIAGGRALADPAIAAGYNLSTRLHVLLWGDERGR